MSGKTNEPSEADAVSRSAFRVMAGGALALVAGLASQVVVAAIFGAAADMDAYLTALVVPNYIAYFLINGLSFVLIPAFVQEEEKGSKEDAWALVGTCFWIVIGLFLFVALAGSLLAPQVIDLTAPGFRPDKAQLAASMLAVMFFTVPCIGLMSLMAGIQNARNRFFGPAIANGVGSVGNVLTLLILYPRMGPMALAWGNLLSAILAAAVPTVPVLRHGWNRLLPLKDDRILKLGPMIAPFLIFGLVGRSSSVLERYFASNLPDGDLSYLGYAYKISSILVAVLAVGIASAIFPAMAREYAHRGAKGLGEQAEHGLRLTFATALPAISVAGALSLPIVMVLFERGAFGHDTAIHVSRVVLIVLMGSLLFYMMGNLVSRVLYVVHDTITYPLLTAVTVGLYVPLARVLTDALGYVGLALALPIQMGLAVLIAFFIMIRKVKLLDLRRLGKR